MNCTLELINTVFLSQIELKASNFQQLDFEGLSGIAPLINKVNEAFLVLFKPNLLQIIHGGLAVMARDMINEMIPNFINDATCPSHGEFPTKYFEFDNPKFAFAAKVIDQVLNTVPEGDTHIGWDELMTIISQNGKSDLLSCFSKCEKVPTL